MYPLNGMVLLACLQKKAMETSFLVRGAGWLLLLGVGFVAMIVARSMWFSPKKLEKFLRRQGIKGNDYRFPFGDLQENEQRRKEAQSRPFPFSHDIVPRVLPWLHRGFEVHGNFFLSWIGPFPRVVFEDPQLIREVLNDKSGTMGKSTANPFAKFLVGGLVAHEGEKWSKHRKVLNRAFQIDKLKFMSPAFLTCCSELIKRWEQVVPQDGSSELDVWIEFQNFTGDVISRTAFGSSYEEGRRIFHLITEQTVYFIKSFFSAMIPGYRFVPTKMHRRMKEIDKEIKGLLRNMVSKRYEEVESGISANDDLLGLLLESNKLNSEDNGNGARFGMTIEDVIEECRLFYFAGQETTSVMLTWTMILLSVYPDWQARAREEVLQVFGKESPNYEGLSQLKVVTMILHEVLRLYPPGPFMIRTVKKPLTLEKFEIPPGVHLVLSVISMHRDPEIWGSDALEFRPERFSEGVSKASKNPAAFLPFSSGPRICIGQNFAMVEAKFCLASILRKFAFEISPSYSHAPHQVVTLQPQHGAQVIMRRL